MPCKIRVLIVDDSPVARDALRSILEAEGDVGVVGEASNGVEAISQTERVRPDIVLMDAQMPGMDGVEATRRIKDRLLEIKILFLAVRIQYIDRALVAGADRCLMKDCGRRELLRAVRGLTPLEVMRERCARRDGTGA